MDDQMNRVNSPVMERIFTYLTAACDEIEKALVECEGMDETLTRMFCGNTGELLIAWRYQVETMATSIESEMLTFSPASVELMGDIVRLMDDQDSDLAEEYRRQCRQLFPERDEAAPEDADEGEIIDARKMATA